MKSASESSAGFSVGHECTVKDHQRGFPGPVVKSPPCDAGVTGSIPGPERVHMT